MFNFNCASLFIYKNEKENYTMNFAQAMYREGSVKTTENGAFAYETTGNGALLDLFAQIGALRPRTEAEIRNKFAAAFRENNLLATKMLFYAGDIRQGGKLVA